MAELAVLLAGQLAELCERRHGARKLQTSFNIGLRTVLLPTGDGCRGEEQSAQSQLSSSGTHFHLFMF